MLDIHLLDKDNALLQKALNKEMARLQAKYDSIEQHFLFPNEFRDYFRSLGIDPEEHTIFVLKEDLLRPGLHTGSGDWNEMWRRFIFQNQRPTDQLAIEYLNRMMRRVPWLKR
jgi:hypothetical protein